MIGRAAALAIVVAIVLAIQRVAPAGVAPTRTAVLAFGFALIAAGLLGDVTARIGLPRLSGYLAFGLLCGPYLLNLITSAMARDLQVINGLAIALIAFVAGLELNVGRLAPQLRSMLIVGGVTIAGVFAGLWAVLWLAWPWLSLPEAGGPLAHLAISAVAAALIVSFSPTVSIAVIAESRARGPLTELVLTLVIFGDLVLILLFALLMQLARWAAEGVVSEVSLLVYLSWEIIGSLAFGAVLGALFAIYLRTVAREITLVVLALCAILSAASPAMHIDMVLAALAAGLVVENIAPPAGDLLKEAVERGALPVLIVFFVATGASLELNALAAIGSAALALAVLRLGLIRFAAGAGVRLAGIPDMPGGLAWMGLVSQSGVTLGLATIVAAEFPGWGTAVQTLVIALTAIHVLVGPILFRYALARAGEIGRLNDEAASPVSMQSASP